MMLCLEGSVVFTSNGKKLIAKSGKFEASQTHMAK